MREEENESEEGEIKAYRIESIRDVRRESREERGKS